MLPNLIVIGGQKCGSTLVQKCISEHPDAYVVMEEVPYFQSPDFEHQSLSHLEKLFQGRKERVLGIKRPNYIGRLEVPERIIDKLPDAKLVAVLRNPVDRAVSAYFHNIRFGFIPNVELNRGMELLLDGKYAQSHPRSADILDNGYFFKSLSAFTHFFERNQIHVMLFDDLMATRKKSIEEVYGFLGLDAGFTPPSLNSRPHFTISHRLRLSLLRKANPLMFRYNEDRSRLWETRESAIKWNLAQVLIEFDKRLLARILPSSKPVLNPVLRQRLREVYWEDLAALQKFLGRDLSHWT